MQNSAFGIPVYVVKAAKTSGHFSDLKPLELGIFDRTTGFVATASGNGSEFFLAGGKAHTRDEFSKFYKGMQDPKKSSYFKGKDLISFEKSLPQRPENEEWVIGYNGDPNSQSLVFEKNKQYTLKVRLYGEYAYRKFQRSVERVIHLNTFECVNGECAGDCDSTEIDRISSTKAWAEKINNDVELREFKIHAQPVFDNYASTTANSWVYGINVPDNGDADALFAIRRAFPTLLVTRNSWSKGVSNYIVAAGLPSAPGNFTPSTDVLLALCGTCPSGYSTVTGYDRWVVSRQLNTTTDLDDAGSQTTFAAAIVTAYSATSGSGVYLGITNGMARVQISVATGTAVVPASGTADQVEQIASIATYCTPSAPSAIAWVQGQAGYTVTRDLTLTVNALDCSEAIPQVVGDVVASLVGVSSYVSASAADITAGGQACSKTFQITQKSKFMLDKCESPDLAEYDDLPTFEGQAWVPVPSTDSANTTVKAGIRISAPFYSLKFDNCSFAPDEWYDTKPLQMEVSLWDQSGNPCNFGVKAVKVKQGKYSRLSGEFVAREIIKGGAYFKYEEWEADPRLRQAFDNNVMSIVDRNKYYFAYYLRFKESRDNQNNFGQKGQIWEPVLFVEEGAFATQQALEAALQAVTAKWDVEVKKRG